MGSSTLKQRTSTTGTSSPAIFLSATIRQSWLTLVRRNYSLKKKLMLVFQLLELLNIFHPNFKITLYAILGAMTLKKMVFCVFISVYLSIYLYIFIFKKKKKKKKCCKILLTKFFLNKDIWALGVTFLELYLSMD